MQFNLTEITDVVLIRPRAFSDERGWFVESWEERKFAVAGLNEKFVQDNHSRSARHVLRGLHYQRQHPQGKLVRVTNGAAYDVVVDIRRSSPTFGKWLGRELSDQNHHMLWIPAGCAHGFLALSDSVDFVYRCTDFYSPADECTIRWDDPDLNVSWPLPSGLSPIVSKKDAAAPSFRAAEVFP